MTTASIAIPAPALPADDAVSPHEAWVCSTTRGSQRCSPSQGAAVAEMG